MEIKVGNLVSYENKFDNIKRYAVVTEIKKRYEFEEIWGSWRDSEKDAIYFYEQHKKGQSVNLKYVEKRRITTVKKLEITNWKAELENE